MTRAGVGVLRARAAGSGADQLRRAAAQPDRRCRASRASGRRSGTSEYFAELIDEWAPEAHTDERLYRLGASVIDAIAGGVAVEPLARYFEYWLLRLQGVYPARRPARMRSMLDGGAVMPPREHHSCAGAVRPRPAARGVDDAMKFLRAAVAAAPDALNGVPLDAGAARELETAHSRLINMHLEKELKSVRVLRAMRETIGRGRRNSFLLSLEWSRCNSSSSNSPSSGRPAAACSSSRSTSRWAPARCIRRRSCACSARSPGASPTCSRRGVRRTDASARTPTGSFKHHQFQVILKPAPDEVQQLYLQSLEACGIDLRAHDVRFEEDNWESPTLGAWGIGWQVLFDGRRSRSSRISSRPAASTCRRSPSS